MAGTVFDQPYKAMRDIVLGGTIGEVIQVHAQKSYPLHGGRPQDEQVDGGLLLQVGVHGARMVSHVTGQRVVEVNGRETTLGNPQKDGGLRMATVLMMRLANGGLASATANYLNPKGTGIWGYESLIVFGSLGLVESHRHGQITRLVVGEQDRGPLDLSLTGRDYFEYFLDLLDGTGQMPVNLEEELHPTRVVLRGKMNAEAR